VSGTQVVAAYSVAIGVGELVGALGWVILGAMLDAALVPILLGHFVWVERTPHRKLLPVLALVAMLRVLSIAAVVPRLPVVTWYVTVGSALLIGEILTIRLVEEPWERLNLALRRPVLDLAIAAIGIPAGLIGYLVLRPQPLMPGAGPLQIAAGVVVLVVFAAFTEELLFRGLLQSIAIETFGIWRLGMAYAAGMSGVMYLGSGLAALHDRGRCVWTDPGSHHPARRITLGCYREPRPGPRRDGLRVAHRGRVRMRHPGRSHPQAASSVRFALASVGT